MAISIFLVLTILGGWLAWRRNPMYSAGKTVQVIFLFGGTIAVVLGALIGLVNWTAHEPTGVVVSSDILCFLAGMALILSVAMRVFNPAPTALPEGTKLVTVNRRKIVPWLKALAYILATMGVVALFLSPNGRQILGIFAAMLACFSAFMAMAAYLGAHRLDRALTAVLANPWVHWTYSREQWEAWSEQQASRTAASQKPISYGRAAKIAVGMFLLLSVPSMFAFSNTTLRLSITAGAFVLVAAGAVLAYVSQGRGAANYRKKLLAAQPEAFFAPDGLFVDGEYSAWLGAEIYLLAASVEQTTPPCVSMQFERVRSSGTGIEILPVQRMVMIPAGAEADLEKLQKNLSATCPKARVSLA
ncbi:MAG TPA: hypothetical protein VGG45_12030 [Terracidiphilus sp.]|jgi:hypothetical protein